jgi:hypothetical protein
MFHFRSQILQRGRLPGAGEANLPGFFVAAPYLSHSFGESSP